MTDEELLQKFEAIVEKQIEPINEQLTAVSDRLTSVSGHLTSVDDRLTSVSDRLTSVDDRLTSLEKQSKITNMTLNRLKKDVSYITKKFDEGIVHNERRITKIENHLKLSPIS